MSTFQIILLAVFAVATVVGYLLINNVPSLLHTPLMSAMNALSGITVLGALIATAAAFKDYPAVASIAGGAAVVLAMINVVGGFDVTERMLAMIVRKKGGK